MSELHTFKPGDRVIWFGDACDADPREVLSVSESGDWLQLEGVHEFVSVDDVSPADTEEGKT